MTIEIIIAIMFLIAAALGTAALLSDYEGFGKGCAGLIIGLIALFLKIAYVGSSHEASYLNKQYGTNYTTEDVFWNGSLIEKELLAKNIIVSGSQNLNVNLRQNEEGKKK